MNMTDRTAINLIVSQIEKTGAKLPKPIRDAQARAAKATERARQMNLDEAALSAAVVAAMIEDRDPAADPEVQRLLAQRTLIQGGLLAAVERASTDAVREALGDKADAVVRALQKPYSEAAAELVAAHEVLGDLPLNDTAAILSAGPEAADAWAKARRALEVVDASAKVFTTLMSFTRLLQLNPHHKALRFATVDWATWTREGYGAGDANTTPWDLVRAGLVLALPTAEEYRARVAALDEGSRRTQLEAERRNRDALMGRVSA